MKGERSCVEYNIRVIRRRVDVDDEYMSEDDLETSQSEKLMYKAPYVVLDDIVTIKDDIKTVLTSWGLAKHHLLCVYQISESPSTLLNFIVETLRMARDYGLKIACVMFTKGGKHSSITSVDVINCGVPVIRVFSDIYNEHSDVEDVPDHFRCRCLDLCSHYIIARFTALKFFTAISDLDLFLPLFIVRSEKILHYQESDFRLNYFLSQGFHDDKQAITVCNFSEKPNIFANTGDWLHMKMSPTAMFMIILSTFPKKTSDKIKKKLDKTNCSLSEVKHTFLPCSSQSPSKKQALACYRCSTIPPFITDYLNSRGLIIFTLHTRQVDLDKFYHLLGTLHDICGAQTRIHRILFMIYDPLGVLVSCKGTGEDVIPSECAGDTIVVSQGQSLSELPEGYGRGYIGTYVQRTDDTDYEDQSRLAKERDALLGIPQKVVTVEFLAENSIHIICADERITDRGVQEYKMESHEIVPSILGHMIAAYLLSGYGRVVNSPSVIQNFAIFEPHHGNMDSSLLVKLAKDMLLNSKSYSADAEIRDIWIESLSLVVRKIFKCYQDSGQHTAQVQPLVADLMQNYVELTDAPCRSRVILHHPDTRYIYDLDGSIIKGHEEFPLSLWNKNTSDGYIGLVMVLAHWGRTDDMALYLKDCTSSDVISYLLYAVGVFKHELQQQLGLGAYSSIEDHERLRVHANRYETLAQQIIHDLYVYNRKLSQEILLSTHVQRMRHSALELAYMAEARSFLADPACKAALHDRWWRDLVDVPWWKLFIILLLPCLSPGACRKPDNNDKQANKNTGSGCVDVYKIPAVKCMFHWVFFTAFLLMFSIFVLTGPNVSQLDVIEYIIFVWFISFMVEECIQIKGIFASGHSRQSQGQIAVYLGSFWNILDLVLFGVYLLAVVLRLLSLYTDNSPMMAFAHIFFALDAIVLFVRSLQFFSMHEDIGPLLIMVRYMCQDLFYFLVILIIILIGYGVAFQSILYPFSSLSWELLNSILQAPYLQVYGDISVDEIMAAPNASEVYGTSPGIRNYFGMALAGCYLLFTNVLLLNLLIAMFNSSYERVRSDTEYHHVKHMNLILSEFSRKSPIPPPLVLVQHVLDGVKAMLKRCCNNKVGASDASHEYDLTAEDKSKVSEIVEAAIKRNQEDSDESMSNILNDMQQKIDILSQTALNQAKGMLVSGSHRKKAGSTKKTLLKEIKLIKELLYRQLDEND